MADNCAVLANYAFDPATPLNGYWAVLGVIAFAFQIYGDFSGYTDIARGSAKLLGIDLVENFRFPYLARNPSDFWSRWHISLSSWFRDYLYIPLGGKPGRPRQTLRNLGVTMLLAGLWHGALVDLCALGGLLWGLAHPLPLPAPEPVGGERGPLHLAQLAGRAPHVGVHPGGLGDFPRHRPLPARSLVCRSEPLAGRPGAALEVFALWLLLHTAPLILLQLLTLKYRDETRLQPWPWPVKGLVYLLLSAPGGVLQ